MNNERFEWQTRCEFNAYCKHTLRNELINASKESKRRQCREVNFSDLAPHEEKQLFTVDKYFDSEDINAPGHRFGRCRGRKSTWSDHSNG